MGRDRAIGIRNDLLRTMVGIRLESGVSASQIRALVDKFTGDARHCNPTREVVSFLWVEDIPQDRRAAFMEAVAALSTSPDPSRITA